MRNSVKKILDRYNKTYTNVGLDNLISKWEIAKAPLKAILSKHPNWNEECQAIVFDTDEVREISERDFRFYIEKLQIYIRNNINSSVENRRILNIIDEIKYYPYQFIKENLVSYISRNCDYNLAVGAKTSRVLNKLYTEIGADKLPEYNKLFAPLADSLNPLTIKRHTLLSIHLGDYLTMSQGTGWQSCHLIDDGCYMAGTLSYAMDSTTMMFYTVNADYNGTEYWWQEKITRQVFCYDNYKILQSRLYPNCNITEKITLYRNLVQEIFAKCLELPNLWTINTDTGSHIETGYGSHHYCDYDYEMYNCHMSLLKGYENASYIVVGAPAYCLECTDEVAGDDVLHCSSHNAMYKTCAHCGERISTDDARLIDGEYYCNDCTQYCANCEQYVVTKNTELRYVNGVGYVCESCLDADFTKCDWCGDYEPNEDIIEIDDKSYCDSCVSNHFVECDICGEYEKQRDSTYFDGNNYCEDCYSERVTVCDDCGVELLKTDVVEHEGNEYCEDCLAKIKEECLEECLV